MKNILSIIAIIILLLAGIYITNVLYSEVEEKTLSNHYEQLKIYATQSSLTIEDFFNHFKHSLEFLSNKQEITNFDDNSQTILKNYFESHHDELKAITRISAQGRIIYTYPEREDLIGQDISTQPHNFEIMQTHKPVISDVFTTVQGYRAIVYAYPIFDKNNAYSGSISLVIPFDYIANKFLKDLQIGQTGKTFVVSKAGFELYCSNSDHIGKSIYQNTHGFDELNNMIDHMLSGEEGRAIYNYYEKDEDDDVVKKIAYYKPVILENTFWSIALVTEENEVLESNRGFVVKLILLILLVTFLIILFTYFIAREKRKSKDALVRKELKYKNDLEKIVEIRTNELKELNESLKNDIVKRKKIEQELKNAVEKVEKSEKIKSAFLAQMSHEIRTPINTILSFSSLIKEELSQHVSEELQYGFTGIESAGKRLIRTIDLILNMSDLQLGTHEYIPKEVDICNDIIANLLNEYKVIAKNKNIKLELINRTQNSKVTIDTYSVNQIFANLIDNALKYTEEGCIQIVCERNSENELVISVLDTGVGISQEYLPRIFDEFSQEDMGYTRKFEGNGLGLALVKRYCELNNAKITVESTKGKGSKFCIKFKNNKN